MTDDNANTADLTVGEKLDQVLQRLGALEAQGGTSTRPLFDRLLQEVMGVRETLAGVERELRAINNRLDVFVIDASKIRGDLREHGTRLDDLEGRPN